MLIITYMKRGTPIVKKSYIIIIVKQTLQPTVGTLTTPLKDLRTPSSGPCKEVYDIDTRDKSTSGIELE